MTAPTPSTTTVRATDAGQPLDTPYRDTWRRGITEVSYSADYIWITQGLTRSVAIPADGTAAWVAAAILAALDGRDQAIAEEQLERTPVCVCDPAAGQSCRSCDGSAFETQADTRRSA